MHKRPSIIGIVAPLASAFVCHLRLVLARGVLAAGVAVSDWIAPKRVGLKEADVGF